MGRKKREVKDKETREREIQAAAREVFYKVGYESASMEAIAKKAKIAKGTIYLHYQNKGDLYISLMAPGTQKINDNLLILEDRLIRKEITSGREIIMGFLECYYGVYRNDPDNVSIVAMFQQGDIFGQISEETAEKLNQIARKNNMTVRRIISTGKLQGLLKPDADELMLPDILWAFFTGVVGIERSRKRVTQKDYIYDTLVYSFELLAKAVAVEEARTDEPKNATDRGEAQSDV